MKIKKTLIITLFLLCILMIGAVSASSDTNDTVASSDVNDDTTTVDHTSGEKTSTIDTSKEIKKTNKEDTITTTRNNSGEEKTSTIDTSKGNKNDELRSDGTHSLRSFTGLNDEISGADPDSVKRLDTDYYYDEHSDDAFKYGIDITKSITIIGNHITIDGQGKARIFNIHPGVTVKLINITFINGYVNYNEDLISGGGAIYNQGDLTLENTKFYDNVAERVDDEHLGEGGAIYTTEISTTTIINSTFSNNTAKGNASRGGAIYAKFKINIINSTFNNNTADNDGGAIYTNKSEINVINSTFKENVAYNGGSICTSTGSTAMIINSTFNNNTAKGDPLSSGGAIYTYADSKTDIINSTFNNNTAKDGGAIHNYGELTITNTTFTENTAKIGGGAISADAYATTDIINSIFTNNTANNNGGAIYNALSDLKIKNSIFTNNTANKYGGAIYTWNNTNIDITSSNFTTNKDSTLNNSAICIYNGTNTTKNIHKSIFIDNDVHVITGSVDLDDDNKFIIRTKLEFKIQDINDTTTDKNIILNITESHSFTGNVTVKIGKNEYKIQFTNGIGEIKEINIAIAGTYQVVLDFPGDKDYAESHAKSNNFTIKYPTEFTIDIADSTIDKPITIKITETYKLNGTVTVKIDDNEYNITLTNGIGEDNTILLPKGKYQATINFTGNENYTEATAKSNTFSIKYPTEFTITTIPDFVEGSSIEIGVSEKNKYNGKVNIMIGTETYTITLNNGVGIQTITPNLTPGRYQALLNFPGDENYAKSNARSNEFTVNSKVNPNDIKIYIADTIISPVLDKSNEVNYVCYVEDNQLNYFDGTITVTLYETAFNQLTNKNEYIPLEYTWKFDAGEQITGFWILNNDKIVLRKTNVAESEIKSLNIVSSTHNSNLYNKLFKGKDRGNSVLYIITNTRFKINTIPNAYLDIQTKYPYDITKIKVSYLRTGSNSVSLIKSVKVKADILKIKDNPKSKKSGIKLSLKKVTIKKSAKKLVLKATLKKGKKALKKKKVTFKFNGKKYVRKTNKKGVAKLTIKKSVLKKLKVGKKVKYQVSYGKKTKKRTAKVKK